MGSGGSSGSGRDVSGTGTVRSSGGSIGSGMSGSGELQLKRDFLLCHIKIVSCLLQSVVVCSSSHLGLGPRRSRDEQRFNDQVHTNRRLRQVRVAMTAEAGMRTTRSMSEAAAAEAAASSPENVAVAARRAEDVAAAAAEAAQPPLCLQTGTGWLDRGEIYW